jgi:hypothetical protein
MNCIAISQHKSSYPKPVSFEPGDALVLGQRDDVYPGWIWVVSPSGNEGWAPESLIRVTARDSGVALSAYTARELDTQTGERLFSTRELDGWLWVKNEKGESGWIPKETVRAI